MFKRRKFLLLGILSIAVTMLNCSNFSSTPSNGSNAIVSNPQLSSAQLWSMLEQADENRYVILFRHALAPGTGDPANFQLNDCSTQRNLSEKGRKQAMRIGQELKRRNLPITRVLSSQWCRCLETAKLMDIGEVEPYTPLNSFFSNPGQGQQQTAQLRQFLLKNPHDAGVMVMVTHQVNITAISDIFPQSGEGVVLSINEETATFEVLGRLLPEVHL